MISSQKRWPLDHEAVLFFIYVCVIYKFSPLILT
jgi:hypothetical protein